MKIKGITKEGKLKLEYVLSDISVFTYITENDEGTYDVYFRTEANLFVNYSMYQDAVAIFIKGDKILHLSTSEFYEICIY